MQQWHAIVLIHFLGSSWDRRESPPGASSASRNPGWPPGCLVSRCRSCRHGGEGSYGTATSCNPAWVDSWPYAPQESRSPCWLYPRRRVCSRSVAWGRYREIWTEKLPNQLRLVETWSSGASSPPTPSYFLIFSVGVKRTWTSSSSRVRPGELLRNSTTSAFWPKISLCWMTTLRGAKYLMFLKCNIFSGW